MSLLNNVEAFKKVVSIAAVANLFVEVGWKIFNVFVSFIDFGYNIYDGLRG